MTVKISPAQEKTLRTIAANGGEMDGYAGQKGFSVNSLPPLVRAGLIEDLGTKYTEDGENFATYNRSRITPDGWAWLGMDDPNAQPDIAEAVDPEPEDQFSFTLPAKMYAALEERGAFVSNAPLDKAAYAAFRAAEYRKYGKGGRYTIKGSRDVCEHIVGYVGDLSGQVGDLPLTASEFGSRRSVMARVGDQALKPVVVEPEPVVVEPKPKRTPYDAEHVSIVDMGHTMWALYIPDPEQAKDPKDVADNILDHKYASVEMVATATKYRKRDGALYAGWSVSSNGGYSDIITTKSETRDHLKVVIGEYFEARGATAIEEQELCGKELLSVPSGRKSKCGKAKGHDKACVPNRPAQTEENATLVIPKAVYSGLSARRVLDGGSEALRASFWNARYSRWGRGVAYTLSAPRDVLEPLVVHMESLLAMMDSGQLKGLEFGAPRKVLFSTIHRWRSQECKEVRHMRTGKLVGWLEDGKFIPVDTQDGEKESRETQDVMRHLQKDKPDSYEPVGYSFPFDSVEGYRERAIAWLGEHTNLSSTTINNADYSVALDFFSKDGE